MTQDQQLDKTTIACIRHVTPSGFPPAACDDIANGLRAPRSPPGAVGHVLRYQPAAAIRRQTSISNPEATAARPRQTHFRRTLLRAQTNIRGPNSTRPGSVNPSKRLSAPPHQPFPSMAVSWRIRYSGRRLTSRNSRPIYSPMMPRMRVCTPPTSRIVTIRLVQPRTVP